MSAKGFAHRLNDTRAMKRYGTGTAEVECHYSVLGLVMQARNDDSLVEPTLPDHALNYTERWLETDSREVEAWR